jgi:hypothetical protein
MKNADEQFDSELKERLLNYSEEPDKDYWKAISGSIVAINAEPVWVIWSTRLLTIGFLTTIPLFYIMDEGVDEPPDPVPHITHAMGGAVTPKPEPNQAVDRSAIQQLPASDNRNNVSMFADSRPDQVRLTGLPSELAEEDQISWNVIDSLRMLSNFWQDKIIPIQSTFDVISQRQNRQSKTLPARDSTEPRKSQQSGRKLRGQKMFTLYSTVMPTFGYQRIASNSRDNVMIQSIKRVPTFSRERLGVRIEAGSEIKVSKRWRAFGGILYHQREQTIAYIEKQVDTLMFHTAPQGDLIVHPQLNYLSRSTEYAVKNVGVQVGMSYQLGINRKKRITAREALSAENLPDLKPTFSHILGTGFEFHRAINRAQSFEGIGGGFNDPSVYVFFNAYYRLQYPSVGRFRAVFQPTLNYSIYINKDLNAPFYVKPYGLGLNFGCTYHFR